MIITYLIGVITSIILCSIVLGVIDAIGQNLRGKYSVLLNFESFEYGSVIVFSFLWPIVLPIIIFILFVIIIRIMTSAVILKLFYLKDASKNKGVDNE